MSLQWDCVLGILRRAQGSAKKTNNEQFGFTHRLTSGRVCSTVIVGVPTLISFVVPLLAYMFIYQHETKTGPKRRGTCWAKKGDAQREEMSAALQV